MGFVSKYALLPGDSEFWDELWFAERRWGDGKPAICPRCGGHGRRIVYHNLPYRCMDWRCNYVFSVRVGTFMQGTKIAYSEWREVLDHVRGRLYDVDLRQMMDVCGLSKGAARTALARLRAAVETDGWLPVRRCALVPPERGE